MVSAAKRAGCAVGTTTNGSLLTSEGIERLVGEGIDVIAFSLTGIDRRNDAIRRGTSINSVLHAIEEIHRLKATRRSENPKIHIAYMLFRSTLDDLEKLPTFFGSLGVNEVVVSSLSLIVRPELEAESLFSLDKEAYLELRRGLANFRDKAAKEGVAVFFHITSPLIENAMCSENVHRALVIGSDGSVSPCVMTNVPAKDGSVHYLEGVKRRLQRIEFGNILDTALNNIWGQGEYERFRESVPKHRENDVCGNCLKLRIDNVKDVTV